MTGEHLNCHKYEILIHVTRQRLRVALHLARYLKRSVLVTLSNGFEALRTRQKRIASISHPYYVVVVVNCAKNHGIFSTDYLSREN